MPIAIDLLPAHRPAAAAAAALGASTRAALGSRIASRAIAAALTATGAASALAAPSAGTRTTTLPLAEQDNLVAVAKSRGAGRDHARAFRES